MTRTTTRRRMFGALAAAVALLVLSACGGAAGDGVASAGGEENSANPANPAENPDTAALDADVQALVFAGCMRENGVDMLDPGPGQQGMNEAWQAVAGNYDRSTLERAFTACQDLIPRYPGQEEHGSDDWQLAVAECLREQGLDVSDDVFNDIHSGEIDQDELAAAMEKCRNVTAGAGQ